MAKTSTRLADGAKKQPIEHVFRPLLVQEILPRKAGEEDAQEGDETYGSKEHPDLQAGR